jgi:hypothetical protein
LSRARTLERSSSWFTNPTAIPRQRTSGPRLRPCPRKG